MPAPANSRHLEEEEVLEYSMREATTEELPRWEEHLAACDSCRAAVAECHAYLAAMRSAAAELRLAPRAGVRRRLVFQALVPAGAALALLALSAVVFLPRAVHAPVVFAVHLAATRNPGVGAPAPARTPLLLQPDLTGLPAQPSYRLQVVDRAGKPVWRGSLAASAAAGGVSIPPLAPGVYFARISSPQGELYREYGLQVGAR
jgi:hypothetical protein